MEKSHLRPLFLEKRNLLPLAEKREFDQILIVQLLDYIKAQSFSAIHTYLPIGSEVDFYPVIKQLLDMNIKVVCPKTENKPIFKNLVLRSLDKLEKGRFGTKHPSNTMEYNGSFDLIIVPGLAYNAKNYRLGYGGGYYDYFLKQHPHAVKLGLFYSFQKYEELPIEDHDVPLDIIFTNDTP
jgi:5-formyltetrahydrofolate cyclo-ligase